MSHILCLMVRGGRVQARALRVAAEWRRKRLREQAALADEILRGDDGGSA